MKITNLEIAQMAASAFGIELQNSLEWLSKYRLNETEEVDGYQIGDMLVLMDNEIFDLENPYLDLGEEE